MAFYNVQLKELKEMKDMFYFHLYEPKHLNSIFIYNYGNLPTPLNIPTPTPAPAISWGTRVVVEVRNEYETLHQPCTS